MAGGLFTSFLMHAWRLSRLRRASWRKSRFPPPSFRGERRTARFERRIGPESRSGPGKPRNLENRRSGGFRSLNGSRLHASERRPSRLRSVKAGASARFRALRRPTSCGRSSGCRPRLEDARPEHVPTRCEPRGDGTSARIRPAAPSSMRGRGRSGGTSSTERGGGERRAVRLVHAPGAHAWPSRGAADARCGTWARARRDLRFVRSAAIRVPLDDVGSARDADVTPTGRLARRCTRRWRAAARRPGRSRRLRRNGASRVRLAGRGPGPSARPIRCAGFRLRGRC